MALLLCPHRTYAEDGKCTRCISGRVPKNANGKFVDDGSQTMTLEEYKKING